MRVPNSKPRSDKGKPRVYPRTREKMPPRGFFAEPGRIDQLRQLHADGKNWIEISADMGTNSSSVSLMAKRLGLKAQPGKGRESKGPGDWWSAENRIERLTEMREKGWSTVRCANELGTTKNAVIGVLNRFGIDDDIRNRSAEKGARLDEMRSKPQIPETTLYTRCDALHAKLDAVLEETSRGNLRVPDKPRVSVPRGA